MHFPPTSMLRFKAHLRTNRRQRLWLCEHLEPRQLLAAGVNMAIYEFTNHGDPNAELFSTDTHTETTASEISSPLSLGSTGNGQPPRGLALGGAFNETTEPTPLAGQDDYFEFTVTPQPGYQMSTARFSMQIRRNDPDSKNSYALYYDNDPGAGGNNFVTKLTSGVITSEDIFETITVDVEGLADFTDQTTALTFRVYAWGTAGLGTMRLDNIRVQAVQETASESALAYYGDANRLLHPLDALGNRIPDFSAAGYKNSNQPIPDVASTIDPARIIQVAPSPGDDMPAIQAAIDQVEAMTPDANGFRGVIQLAAGEFEISDQLVILESGIVLRGTGDGDNPASNTILRGTGTTQRSLIRVGEASGFASGIANTTHNIVDDYVPVGATSLNVDSTANWSVGDAVVVDRQSTANWISDIGMDMIPDDGDVVQWTPGGNFDQLYERVITRIEGNRIFLNAPLFGALEQQYGGGTVWRYTFPRINHVGIEDVRGISDFVAPDDEAHAWTFIELQAVEDAWVTNVTGRHFGFATVHATGRAMRVTVDDAQSLDPVSIVTGGRRYPFTIDGQFILMQNLYSEDGRHDFVNNSAWRNRGPNVFLNGTAVNSNSSTGPHQRWSTGTLYDTISTDNIIEARNRGNFGTGHGWAGANMVFWNTTATQYIVQNPPTAQNWVIGSSGQMVGETRFGPQPMGTYSEHETPIDYGDPTNPTSSLFVAQLNQRTEHADVEKREYMLGDFDLVVEEGAGSDDDPMVDPAWEQDVSDLGTRDFLDHSTDGRFVPFSFEYQLDVDEIVQTATLFLGLRSTGGDTTNDFLYLDSIANSKDFPSLGLTTQLSTTETTPVLIELTGNELDWVNDGRLNLAVGNNTAVDWAVFELTVRDHACEAPDSIAGAYTVETFFDPSTFNCEQKLFHGNDQFGVVLQTVDGAVVHRARPQITDPDAWGSSKQENVFVAGADATGGRIESAVATPAGIQIATSGNIPSDGGNLGSWTWDAIATFDPAANEVFFDGATHVTLTGTLPADLNIGRISSNALHTHELNHGGRGDSGDLSSIEMTIGANPTTAAFPTPQMPADFPGLHAAAANVTVIGNLNLTDPSRFQVPKPTIDNDLRSLLAGTTVNAGWLWTPSAADFSNDNVGASFLVKPVHAAGVTRMQFDNDATWTIPAAAFPQGSARFRDAQAVAGGTEHRAVARADIDSDGDLDLFLAIGGLGLGAPNQVLINQQNPDPAASLFADSGQTLGSGESFDVGLADVDGDGDPDAFVANHGANTVWINQGGAQRGSPGTFTDSGQLLGDASAAAVAMGDLDSDGDIDAFVGNRGNEPNRIWLNQGGVQGGTEGIFSDSGQRLGSTPSVAVALGDIDKDGDLDAIVANQNNGPNRIWVNQGRAQGGVEGVFAAAIQLSDSAHDVLLRDFDGDNDLDVLFAHSNDNRLWFNLGGIQGGTLGTFGDSGQSLGGALNGSLAASDVDADQDLDFFVTSAAGNKLLLNQGGAQGGVAGEFVDSQQIFGTSGIDVAIGDYDSDDDLDVVITDAQGNHRLWFNEFFDFGDAPAMFPTTIADDGARHVAAGPSLGSNRDSEFDGQPTPAADGDDDGGTDDEDGVMFGTIVVDSAQATVSIDLENAAAARVDAWLDFDSDGIWQADEKILDNLLVTDVGGPESFNFNINTDAVVGDTFARVRVSSTGGLDPTGAAVDGEVEDYLVTIEGGNVPPVLASIGNQSVDEGVELSFTTTATDPDIPANMLTFGLDTGAPAGATIDPATGQFMWTPTEAQGPGTYHVTVRVTDDGTPNLDDFETIEIVVAEVNQPPELATIGNQSVDEGVELSFTAAATDLDIPANMLTFSLDAGAPAGATIDPATGQFTWTPTEAQGPGTYHVTVRVTDDGSPNLDDFEAIEIVVQPLLDYGDAPTRAQSGFANDYPVTRAQDGGRHAASALYLGELFDTELDGRPDFAAGGDDNDQEADEDGIRILSTVLASSEPTESSLQVVSSQAGKLDAWIDFNRDGDWLDPHEQLFTNSVDLVSGSNLVSFTIPAGASAGDTYARFRLSSNGSLQPTGEAADGEVEDYVVSIVDGMFNTDVFVDLAVGDVVAAAESGDLIIRHDDLVVLRAPEGAVNQIRFLGTDGNDSVGLGSRTSPGAISVVFVGGDGVDRLQLTESGQALDLTSTGPNQLVDLEQIDVVGAGPNELVMDGQGVINATDADHRLIVIHDKDDTITFQGQAWQVLPPIFVDGGQRHRLIHENVARVEVINDLPFHNPLLASDVNFNGETSSLDALQVINFIARFNGDPVVDLPTPASESDLPERYYDVNASHTVTSLDALLVINFLGRQTNSLGLESERPVLREPGLVSKPWSLIAPRSIRSDNVEIADRSTTKERLWRPRSLATVAPLSTKDRGIERDRSDSLSLAVHDAALLSMLEGGQTSSPAKQPGALTILEQENENEETASDGVVEVTIKPFTEAAQSFL